jgi:hypothetical protein
MVCNEASSSTCWMLQKSLSLEAFYSGEDVVKAD